MALEAVPTIRDLRDRAVSIRVREFARALAREGIELDDAHRDAFEHMTRAIVNKLLHPPLSHLRAQTDREEGIAILEAARALFGLDENEGEDEAEAEGDRAAVTEVVAAGRERADR